MAKSSIEWTDETWNPVVGCTRASEGCDNCYAVKQTKRLEAMGQEKYAGLVNIGKNHFNGVVRVVDDALTIPLRWNRPRKVFVNSMSDLFHPLVPFWFIDKCFAIMALTPQHTYQVLTKRPERMAEYFGRNGGISFSPEQEMEIDRHFPSVQVETMCDGGESTKMTEIPGWWDRLNKVKDFGVASPPNVWLGTSVENQETADERIPHLLKCPAAVRFLSCEPLLGPVDLTGITIEHPVGVQVVDCLDSEGLSGEDDPDFNGETIHWVICGGESGAKARPMHPDWARSLRDQCQAAGVPFFFKQVGEWDCYEPSNPLFQSSFSRRAVDPAIFPDWDADNYDGQWLPDMSDGVVHHKVGKHRAGRLLDGRTWDEFPEVRS
jgi:protein gp37